jgi:ferric-dicitrate binding protein FerR (iron transport regulator)
VVPAKFNKKRSLSLNGRAFFEVKKGSKFTVITDNGTVEVLGTSFSVLSRENIFEVICKTGKVSVSTKDNADIQIITPSEKVILTNNKLVKSNANNESLAWKDGNYYFDNASLLEVIKELENQFKIKIKTDEKNLSLRYTGFFNTDNLGKALHSVTWPLNLKYELVSNHIVEIK